MKKQEYFPEAGQDHLMPENSPEMVVQDTIHFNDLPKIWQEHILKRQAGGFLAKNKMIFTKDEILEATADKSSFSSPLAVNNVFERIKKEKIPLDYLPKKWRDILEPKNKFSNITIEELKKAGASMADIEKIKTGFYRQNKEIEKIAELKNDIAENAVSSMIGQPAEWQKPEVGADLTDKPEASKTGWWSKIKSWWK